MNMPKDRPGIYIMSDEEFSAMKNIEDQESFLDSLMEASRNDSKFTTKNIKKKPKDNNFSDKKGESLIFGTFDIPERIDDDFSISDDQWDSMMGAFDEISPIDDISDEDRYVYRSRRRDDEDEYEEMFKKERSMYNEVLSDIQKRSKIINTKIVSMSGKGAYGMSKNYVDLVQASAQLDNSKISVIDKLVNIKKSIVDLRMKDRKLHPDTMEEDKDSIADSFYKQIIGGGNKQFLQNSLSPYSSMQKRDSDYHDSDEEDDIQFNVTQPINQQLGISEDEYGDYEIDKYGYIANEKKNVDIVVERYPDGSMKFAALDENGDKVSNYELPNAILLQDLQIKPLSTYAHDKFDRKYKIIDVPLQTVDLDELDDDYYDSITNDDKYNVDDSDDMYDEDIVI